jgi:anti-sigma factor RsiW
MPLINLGFWFWHPSDEQIAAWVDGGLERRELARVTEHLLTCPECYELASDVLVLQAEAQIRSDAS